MCSVNTCGTHACSSFDEYVHEVRSGRLEWSPVHKSEKFWVSHFLILQVSVNLEKLLQPSRKHTGYACVLILACTNKAVALYHYM